MTKLGRGRGEGRGSRSLVTHQRSSSRSRAPFLQHSTNTHFSFITPCWEVVLSTTAQSEGSWHLNRSVLLEDVTSELSITNQWDSPALKLSLTTATSLNPRGFERILWWCFQLFWQSKVCSKGKKNKLLFSSSLPWEREGILLTGFGPLVDGNPSNTVQ